MNPSEEAPQRPRTSDQWLEQMDPDLAAAVAEIDTSLIQLALLRSPFERLRAGVAMAVFATRFRRGAPEGR